MNMANPMTTHFELWLAGAVLVDVTGGDGGESGIEAVAFVNKDDSVVVVNDDHNQDGKGGRNHVLNI